MQNNYCNFLLNCISFHQLHVRFCTTLQLGQVISEYKENPVELANKITDLRKSVKDGMEKGVIPEGCKDCIYRKTEAEENDKIKRIDLYYWYHCNCGCFYCSYRDVTKGEFSDKVKEGNPVIYKTLKELYKLNQIDKNNLHVNFGGGELGVLKEFPKLIDLFLDNNVMNVWCETSGIRYSKAVEKLLRRGKGGITAAVCSGCKETYKKIKHRDKYNQVMKNLGKYVKAAKKNKEVFNNSDKVVSKFIILNGFNNNYEEIDKWLAESKKYGLTQVEISMEFCWGIQTKAGQKIEDYNYKIFDYVERKAPEMGLKLRKNETSMALMEKGVY